MMVLAAGLGSCAVLGNTKPEPEKKENTVRPIALKVDEVKSDTVVLSVNTQGEVRAKTEIDIISEVSGRIVSVSSEFAEGSSFEPSTTLIKIDDSNYKLAVTRAEARVADAYVQLEQQLANAKLKQKQWDDSKAWIKDGKPTALALNKPQVAQAQANLRAAEADLAEANLNLSRTNIRMPFNGRVTERSVGVGQFVTTGAKLGRVFGTDVVEIRLPLTDLQLAELNLPVGFEAKNSYAPKVTLKARIGNQQQSWEGKIVRTLASIDQQTRLAYAMAEVEKPYAQADGKSPLPVGLFVSAEIEGIKSQAAFVMPRTALREEDKVYIIDDGKLRIKTVDVLATSKDRLLVSSGVNVGDQVVTSAVRTAIEGMAVEPITTGTNVAAAPADAASR
ncbi:efflux RND transporter periplasmic adaptor subunit [Kordiimonas sp. SCSIO 12610]|nr:efflux RND transporter periplasmic adaptor subunit [Kordiimonas sp. SCSIO 12610]